MDLAADLQQVFFDPQDFALRFERVRPGVANAPVCAIVGEQSDEGFEGRSLLAHREALLPATADVVAGDVLRLLEDAPLLAFKAGDGLRVSGQPERRNDGAELLVRLVREATP